MSISDTEAKSTDQRRHREVEAIFDRVFECDENQREMLLARLCKSDRSLKAEVESLLEAAVKAQGFLSVAPTAVEQMFADKLNPSTLLDKHFGPYRLLEVVEKGGMGVVYLAERSDGHYEEKVAIKFANYQMEVSSLMARFSRERQILVKLRHPHVARLLDAGSSAEGYPYIVMEYVDGQAIDKYCQINSLPIRQTLALMLTVCDTVQHAHQNLIVHCDLKPGNILVTSKAWPVLLDFGIAQLLDPIRQEADVKKKMGTTNPMTPEFAAPEQKVGQTITTATDVHALGNILYRLLAGLPPQHTGVSLNHSASADMPELPLVPPGSVAPSHRRQELRGDLDNIVLKAMNPDPKTRYVSAQALANDIRNYLDDLPVSATNAGLFYHGKKFLRRHKLGAALASLTVISIVAGISGTALQWFEAQRAKQAAETRLIEIRTLANTIVFDLPDAVNALPGTTALRERLLNQAVAYLDRLSSEQQDAGLMQELGRAYHELASVQGNPVTNNLGDPAIALENHQKSIAIRRSLIENDPQNSSLKVELATSYSTISVIYGALLNDPGKARELTDQCIDLLEPLPTDKLSVTLTPLLGCLTLGAHWANVQTHSNVATIYLEKATSLLSAIPDKQAVLHPNELNRLTGRVHEEWAQIFAETGHPLLAVWHERQRLSRWLEFTVDLHKRERLLGAAYHGLAARLAQADEVHQAMESYREALNYWTRWQERYPDDVGAALAGAIVHAELADLLWQNSEHSADRKISCQHYQHSINSMDMSFTKKWPLPKRYSWSPSAELIRHQYAQRCNMSVSTPDNHSF